MIVTREILSDAYETDDELVIELELPDAACIDTARVAASVEDGLLELRLRRLPIRAQERPASRRLPGFHPDVTPC